MMEDQFLVRDRQFQTIHRLIACTVFDVGESNAETYYTAVLQASSSRNASD